MSTKTRPQPQKKPTRPITNQHILTPSRGPAAWRNLLADPARHWKPGHSAHALAHAWELADDFPTEIRSALVPHFPGIELVLAIPERRVQLPGRGGASQTDLWALCRTDLGLISLGVEGKVNESFGPTLGQWRKDASTAKKERLDFHTTYLGLVAPPADSIRYQLLHRCVSALLEARRVHAACAVMLVHSFSPDNAGWDDFEAFAASLGVMVEPGHLTAVPTASTRTLHIGWVNGAAG
jgi:hypothetical protein